MRYIHNLCYSRFVCATVQHNKVNQSDNVIRQIQTVMYLHTRVKLQI